MTDNARLIVVSNRLPVSLIREDTAWHMKRSAGGLATAMDPILKRAGGLWIGWSGTTEPVPAEVQQQLRQEQSCLAVELPPAVQEKFYEGYSNAALWPLFHSFPSRLQFEPENWAAYQDANRRFCAAAVQEFRPGDRIWVHDYHLMLLPDLLRAALPTASIGFFLHTPFPASDIFALLPRGEELLTGLLGADLIAFHTHLHLQHFRASLRRLVGIESTMDRLTLPGREVRLMALPIGIAPADFFACRQQPETQEQGQKLQAQYHGRKRIVAVDRLDYTKGIPQRLQTFRRLLRSYPEWVGKVVLLQVAVPSRENLSDYQSLRQEVHALISEINGEFGTLDWVPIVYLHRGLSQPELVALYECAEVAWVAPLRDGMNLVAKEYIACHPEGQGVLVLSSFAGAAAEMGEALLINPYDEERTVSAVIRALVMSEEERGDRMKALHARVLHNDVFAWGDRFLALLGEAALSREEHPSQTSLPLPVPALLSAYREAKRRLFVLDYDGTLVPLAARPSEAVPTPDLPSLLTQLASDPTNGVMILSGRRATDLERWLGSIPHLGLAAEHGTQWRLPNSDVWQSRAGETEWKNTVRPVLEHFVDRVPGSFIEEKELALVWHYRTAEAEFGEWLAAELVPLLEEMLAETDLRAYRGKKIVEVKPVWANKGHLLTTLPPEYAQAEFILGIGDDRTDEDLFASLPENAWSVHVGGGPSQARFRLPSPAHVRQVLQQFFPEDKSSWPVF